jgi:hypothetical protein
MRRTFILLLTAGVFGMGAGCCRTLQYTAGVCDCNPPPVESVLRPYEALTPAPEQVPVPNTIHAVPAPPPANGPEQKK